MAITREEAVRIAEEYIAAHPAWEDYRIGEVITLEKPEELQRFAGRLYGGPNPEELRDCWIAYLEEEEPPHCLRSSTILLIKKSDGKVIYAASAGDEG